MTAIDFDTLFAYSDKCREQLQAELLRYNALPTEPFVTTSPFDSIRKLIAHCIGAEERLVLFRLQNNPVPLSYEDRVAETIAELFADWQTIRRQTDVYRRTLTREDYARVFTLSLALPHSEITLSVADVFFHVINHESYHRGQVIMLLQRNGIEVPNFDYLFLKPSLFL